METKKKDKVLTSSFQYLLDTSALIAYLSGEEGGEKIVEIKEKATIPFIALSELYYVIWNKRGKTEADRFYGLVKSWRLPILQPNEETILTAGRFKARYRLGVADSYIAAFAATEDLWLVTKDKDYQILKEKIRIWPIY